MNFALPIITAAASAIAPILWILTSSNQRQPHNTLSTSPKTSLTLINMADGIDRKADEKMEFSTSKEVTVAPTFEAMHLKGRYHAPGEE
jgi:hypothetical protein